MKQRGRVIHVDKLNHAFEVQQMMLATGVSANNDDLGSKAAEKGTNSAYEWQ
jgi:hypothetical protein